MNEARASSSSDCVATSELARACTEHGLFSEALQHYRTVLRETLERYGPDHRVAAKTKVCLRVCVRTRMHVLAFAQVNIANVLRRQGQLQAALEMYIEALPVLEAKLGRNHLDTAKTLNNIGAVYYAQGKLSEALEMWHESLTTKKKVVGHTHPDVAATYSNIGAVYNKEAKYPEALGMYRKALAIDEKVYGPEHPVVAETCNKYAYMLMSLQECMHECAFLQYWRGLL